MSDACRGADVALGLDLEKLGVCCFFDTGRHGDPDCAGG